jgi:hypothetical protein
MKRWISSGAADAVQKAAILLDVGADISARDEEYRSTPLAWAARSGAVEMVKFLLSRGVPTNLPDDEPWATPLAWAERRQHANTCRSFGSTEPAEYSRRVSVSGYVAQRTPVCVRMKSSAFLDQLVSRVLPLAAR